MAEDGMQVYSLYDRKLKEFGGLVVARNDASVIRSLGDGVRGTGSMVEAHPDDFDLMRVGRYHPDTGFLTGVDGPPQLVANVGDVLRVKVVNDGQG